MHRFADVSGVVARGAGTYAGEVSPDWTVGSKPNGGYLLAMLGRAAVEAGAHPHVIAASAHYFRSPDAGGVDISTEVRRSGRSTSQHVARMTQDGLPCVDALITTSTLATGGEPFWADGLPPRGSEPFDGCERLLPQSPGGIRVSLMEQIDVRLEPASMGFASDAPRGRGELRGWLRLLGDEQFDPISLLFAVDAFPPATFDIALSGWVPTLELTVYVRAMPAPGPVQVLHRAQLIDGRRVDETCHIWDATGRLVAQSTQLAGIRLG